MRLNKTGTYVLVLCYYNKLSLDSNPKIELLAFHQFSYTVRTDIAYIARNHFY